MDRLESAPLGSSTVTELGKPRTRPEMTTIATKLAVDAQ